MSKKEPTINEQIKKERLKQGLTRYKVSKLMGISQTHYNSLETSLKSPSLSLIQKACIALDVAIITNPDGKTELKSKV